MKYFVVILASLVPLVVVTAGSFVDLAKVDEQIEADAVEVNMDEVAGQVESAATECADARKAAADFAMQEFLRPQPVKTPQQLPQSEQLAAVYQTWPSVVDTHRLIAEYLGIEERIEADWRKPGSQPLEQAMGDLEKLRQRADQPGPPPKDDLLLVIDGRIGELRAEIALRRLKAELAERVAAAQQAFRQGEDLRKRGQYAGAVEAFAECRQRCGEAVDAKYADVRDPTTASQIQSLDAQAEFYAECCRLRERLEGELHAGMDFARLCAETARQYHDADVAAALQAACEEIRRFLDRYRAQWQSTGELTYFADQHQKALAALETAGRNSEAKQQTEALVAAVDRGDLPDFTERLDRVITIVSRYPTPKVKTELRNRYSTWLGEAFPARELGGLDAIQEIETGDGRILQGYFKPWPSAQSPSGYQRYESREAAMNPSSRPGVIELSEIRVPPHEPVPASCIRQYNAARLGLLAGLSNAPDIKRYADQLAKFVKTCEDLEKELAAYRAKPGSLKVELSFAHEQELARRLLKQVLESPEFEALLGPLPS